MGTTQSTPPGIRGQRSARIVFRVVGVVLLVAALGVLAVGLQNVFSTADSFDGPDKFWMVFVGILLLGPAGWCLQAGFVGAASRYVAGERADAGPFCSTCGADASYCDGCGAALAR